MVCWYPLWGLTVVSKDAFVLNRQIRLYTSSTVHLWHCYFYHSWTFWCHVCFPYCVLPKLSMYGIFTVPTWMASIYGTCVKVHIPYHFFGTTKHTIFTVQKRFAATFGLQHWGWTSSFRVLRSGRAFPMPLRQAGGQNQWGGVVKIWWSPLLILPYNMLPCLIFCLNLHLT